MSAVECQSRLPAMIRLNKEVVNVEKLAWYGSGAFDLLTEQMIRCDDAFPQGRNGRVTAGENRQKNDLCLRAFSMHQVYDVHYP